MGAPGEEHTLRIDEAALLTNPVLWYLLSVSAFQFRGVERLPSAADLCEGAGWHMLSAVVMLDFPSTTSMLSQKLVY